MRLFNRELTGLPKAIVLLSAILLLASGICGINDVIEKQHHWYISDNSPRTWASVTLFAVDALAFGTIFLLVPVLVMVLCIFLVRLFRRTRSAHAHTSTQLPLEITQSHASEVSSHKDQQGEP